jgi:glycosyltransferase involved in cell wall biosynthesis
VVAGPLTTITSHLVGIDRPIVGLSWGFDLYELSRDSSSASWLIQVQSLIVDSEATLGIALNLGVAQENVFMIPWGVDLDIFTPDPQLPKAPSCSSQPEPITLLSLRALEPVYRVGDIIEAFARLPRTDQRLRLTIGNDGSLKHDLIRLTEDLGITDSVSFIGRVAETDLPAILRSASIYVTASEVDGTSVTLLQAMACGVPVVASDSSGNRPWVESGRTGHMFSTGDLEALTGALSRSIQNLQSRQFQAMSQAARQRVVTSADWKRNIGQLGAILDAAADA